MNILFFCIGDSTLVHMQSLYSIRTAYVHSNPDDQIYIITDSPALYQKLPFVKVIEITPEEILEWKGPYGYFFRIKINAIRKFAQSHDSEHLMFLDSDTYCIKNLEEIKILLQEGYGVMHKDEGSMEKMKGDSAKMWSQTCGKIYANIKIGKQRRMWNSGVVALPKEVAVPVMNKALDICDAMLADGVTCFNMEQWGVSIALGEFSKEIKEAASFIGHYWHYKYVWTRFISCFFTESYAHGRSLEDELDIIRKTDHKKLARKLYIKRTLLKILFLKH